MNRIKLSAVLSASALLCALMMANCAPKAVTMDMNNVPDTPHCDFMKETCKEAQNFQQRYEVMSAEEKEEAKVILNAYVQQCADAQEMCKKSAGQK